MNISHLKYAIAVEKEGSINKAAKALLLAQPNLSKSIQMLEDDLGITIFERTNTGMVVTPEGERFLGYAKKLLKQIDELEALYHHHVPPKKSFSVSVPRASYISSAFAQFSGRVAREPIELIYRETGSEHVIDNVLRNHYNLGVLRYAVPYERYFSALIQEKELIGETIAEFTYVLVMGKNSPLAQKETIVYADLQDMIEIAHADPYIPSLSQTEIRKQELPDTIDRRIFVFERASQFELLSTNPQTYMWVSPIPGEMLERYQLVQRACQDNRRVFRDVLIRRRDYRLTELDRQFIAQLQLAKSAYLSGCQATPD